MTQHSSDTGGADYPLFKNDEQQWVAHNLKPVRRSGDPDSEPDTRHSRCSGAGAEPLQEKCAVKVSRSGGIPPSFVNAVHCIQGNRFNVIIKSEIFCGYAYGILRMELINILCKAF